MKRRHSANTDDLRNSLTYFSTFLDTSNRTRDYHYTSRQSCRHFPLAHTSPINPVAASTPTRVSLLPRWCPSAKRRLNNQPSWTVQLSYPFTIILQLLQRMYSYVSPLLSPSQKKIHRLHRRLRYFEISLVPRESQRSSCREKREVNETAADSYKWTIRLNAGFL